MVKIPNNRRKESLLILFLILCVLCKPVLLSAVLCFGESEHVEIEFAHDGPTSFSQCQVASSASSQAKGFDIAPKGKEDQCYDIPVSNDLALNNIIPFDPTSPQIITLTQETHCSAFVGPRTLLGNAIFLDKLPFETSVSLSLQITILII
jgi:hypothetical protein